MELGAIIFSRKAGTCLSRLLQARTLGAPGQQLSIERSSRSDEASEAYQEKPGKGDSGGNGFTALQDVPFQEINAGASPQKPGRFSFAKPAV
jgi:hypothetical protein